MLDVCLLGTGGMMPLPRRWLTSLMCRFNGSNILIDCGEGTQVAIKQKGWTFKPIDVICITHYHADHISGLPGLLLTMGNAERKEPLTMIGPKGLERVVKALRTIAPELPFEIKFIELTENMQTIQFDEYRINAFKVKHNVVCYGYSIEIDRIGKFNAQKAKKLEIPVQKWNVLQKGNEVTIDGKTQKLEPPFFVVATENPVETAGTFPLPEAQMDRFLMKLSMGLPTREEEVQILDTYMTEDPLKKLTAVIDQETLERMQKEAMEVYVHPTVRGYLADLSAATRSSDQTVMGVSPRGTIALMRASRAWAYLEGRSFVTPDDVKAVAGPVMAHRVVLSYGQNRYADALRLIEEILNTVPAPTEDFSIA